MNDHSQSWKQLKSFERRGDLQKQAEVIRKVLGAQLPAAALPELLQLAQQRALQDLQKNPEQMFRVNMQQGILEQIHPLSAEVIKSTTLPREAGASGYHDMSWSPIGKTAISLLEVQNQQLLIKQEWQGLLPQQCGLVLNTAYAYYNLEIQPSLMSALAPAFRSGQMPLESARSLPYDLFASPMHPYLAVADRGAGKLHLMQRDNLKLFRSWPIVPAPNKKALSVAFHPDGKRIFVTANQAGLLVMLDRGMAQKKLPLPSKHLVSQVRVSPQGQVVLLLIDPETRRPDLWLLDGQKLSKEALIPLEDEAFSTGSDAHDLMELTPDGKYAIVMVSRNQPALFTPHLLLVDLQQRKIVDKQMLKPDQKPVNLAFPARKLVNPRFRLLPMLLHAGYGLTEDSLRLAFGVTDLT